ncbi:MAG: hypothetical protein HY716_14450 [Planctomycetes bacterium]|nr:hypothetical protein [Planctomycetota bacterium]
MIRQGEVLAASSRAGKGARGFLDRVAHEFLGHPIVVDNRYTRWFRKGEAAIEELRHFTRQFSVFSNQFLVAQLKKMINAGSLEAMRSAKEILANEIGVIFRRPGEEPRRGPARTEEAREREGDPELVGTSGTVDGGTFRFRAGHFEWLLNFASALGLGFNDLGQRRHGAPATLFFCDELIRLYGSEDPDVAAGAGFAIENWAAAGFWGELIEGLTLIKGTWIPDLKLAFFTWHDLVEAQHAGHTMAELELLLSQPAFDREKFIEAGRTMLDGLAVFWNGLDRDRAGGESETAFPKAWAGPP